MNLPVFQTDLDINSIKTVDQDAISFLRLILQLVYFIFGKSIQFANKAVNLIVGSGDFDLQRVTVPVNSIPKLFVSCNINLNAAHHHKDPNQPGVVFISDSF